MLSSDYLKYGSSIASIVGTAADIYSSYQSAKASQEIYEIQQQTQRYLLADAMETIVNSSKKVVQEISEKARRSEFEMKVAAETARGNAVAAQANTGAQGQRVTLATNQATFGAVDRELGYLQKDTMAAIDAALDQQEYQSKQAVNSILSGPVDVAPAGFDVGAAVAQVAATGLQIYAEHEYGED